MVVLLAGAVLFLVLRGGESQAGSTLDRFLAAWSAEDHEAASALTNDPELAANELEENRVGLDGAALTAEATGLEEDDGVATATIALSWDVPAIGEFAYDGEVELRDIG